MWRSCGRHAFSSISTTQRFYNGVGVPVLSNGHHCSKIRVYHFTSTTFTLCTSCPRRNEAVHAHFATPFSPILSSSRTSSLSQSKQGRGAGLSTGDLRGPARREVQSDRHRSGARRRAGKAVACGLGSGACLWLGSDDEVDRSAAAAWGVWASSCSTWASGFISSWSRSMPSSFFGLDFFCSVFLVRSGFLLYECSDSDFWLSEHVQYKVYFLQDLVPGLIWFNSSILLLYMVRMTLHIWFTQFPLDLVGICKSKTLDFLAANKMRPYHGRNIWKRKKQSMIWT
jgi:hypothetical protein